MSKALVVSTLLVLALAGCGEGAESEGAKDVAAAPTVAPKPTSFKAMDADADGKVTPAEHSAGAENTFKVMDADADGKVTAAEMDTARREVGWFDNIPSKKKIAPIDGDTDGTLTVAEFAAGASALFKQMDTSKDGAVDEPEWTSGHSTVVPNPDALEQPK
jgi:hypothetical protein